MSFIREIARFQPKIANIQMATKSTVLKITISNFLANIALFLLNQKSINFVFVGTPDFMEGQVKKWGQNWKTVIFQGNQEQFFQFAPEE